MNNIIPNSGRQKGKLVTGRREQVRDRQPVPLANSKSLYRDQSAHLVEGQGNTLWMGGRRRNTRAATFGGLLSDGYLAKIDREGRLSWELEVAHDRKTELQKYRLPAIRRRGRRRKRELITAGWRGFRKTDDCPREETFGLGAIASVAVMGDVILVAAFEASGEPVPADPGSCRPLAFSAMRANCLVGKSSVMKSPKALVPFG